MKSEPDKILDYSTPRASGASSLGVIRWALPFALGLPAGYYLSNAGYGCFGFALIAGFGVAVVCSACAPGRRVAFGMLGIAVMWVTTILFVEYHTWRDKGALLSAREFGIGIAVLAGAVGIPGALGIICVWVFDELTRPRSRF